MSDTDRARVLAQFQKKTQEDMAVIAVPESEQYEAFNVKDRRLLSLYIRPVGEPYQWVTYRYLLHTVAAPSGTRLDLVFSFQLVTITGRNLLEIGAAIAMERCEFLQQFDAKQWQEPKDGSAPFIASIQYKMSAPSDMAGEKEAT